MTLTDKLTKIATARRVTILLVNELSRDFTEVQYVTEPSPTSIKVCLLEGPHAIQVRYFDYTLATR